MSWTPRSNIHARTWAVLEVIAYDGREYACGCRPHPSHPHLSFGLCPYHDGYDDAAHDGDEVQP